MVERLQTCIRKVTNHNKSFELELIGNVRWDQRMDNEAPIVWHEPILDRYCRIDLDRNHLNDDDALLISQAPKRNTNLKTLSLHTNNLTCIGLKALINCVFDGSCLNSISESNHTLTRMIILSGQVAKLH